MHFGFEIIVWSLIIAVLFVDATEGIRWNEYDGRYLKPNTKTFYSHAWDVYIPVPQNRSVFNGPIFSIYVRKFSSTRERTRSHLWLISGGPGSSTSGIERALSVQLPDTTIYIMDNRGLGHSHQLCHHSESSDCHNNPRECYESVEYSPKDISMHETAKDYNEISQMILNEDGGNFFMYGSSYGATLAYTAFRFSPQLYAGLLLESFMPNFRLHGSVDVRKHAIDSCYKSETCRLNFGNNLSRSDAEKLVEIILKKETQNECKSAFEFLSGNREGNLNSVINSYTRFAFYSKTGMRPAFFPLLYGIAFCPNIEKFNSLLSEFYAAHRKQMEDTVSASSNLLLSPADSSMHSSTGSKTNQFFGNHIRFSEFSFESEKKFKKCTEIGYLRSANWADVCGMVSGWKEEYRPYLYVPEIPKMSKKALEASETRIVIVSGKLDTQTPHDLAQREFDRLPMREKYIFTADHAGHAVIDEWETPGLSLKLMLSFTMTGSESDKQMIESIIERNNGQADRIWRNWDRKMLTKSGDIWDLSYKQREYSWSIFLTVLSGCLVVPLVTLIFLDISEDDDEEGGKKTLLL